MKIEREETFRVIYAIQPMETSYAPGTPTMSLQGGSFLGST